MGNRISCCSNRHGSVNLPCRLPHYEQALDSEAMLCPSTIEKLPASFGTPPFESGSLKRASAVFTSEH